MTQNKELQKSGDAKQNASIVKLLISFTLRNCVSSEEAKKAINLALLGEEYPAEKSIRYYERSTSQDLVAFLEGDLVEKAIRLYCIKRDKNSLFFNLHSNKYKELFIRTHSYIICNIGEDVETDNIKLTKPIKLLRDEYVQYFTKSYTSKFEKKTQSEATEVALEQKNLYYKKTLEELKDKTQRLLGDDKAKNEYGDDFDKTLTFFWANSHIKEAIYQSFTSFAKCFIEINNTCE